MLSALIFPGQGAPASEWRDAVATWCPDLLVHARQLLEGEDPFELFGAGTEYDQPAIYCAEIAAFEVAGRPDADFHAGHSLGEIAALVCAGALSEHDGLRAVVRRGRLMAKAGLEGGDGAMLAVRASAAQIIDAVDLDGVRIANLNSPSQTVLSGPSPEIDRLAGELAGGRIKTKRLAVAGAFHTPSMAPAAAGLASFLEDLEISEPRVPVVSARTALPFSDIASELPASLLEPVRWIEVVAALEANGVGSFKEIGPGKALAGLVRKSATNEVATETSSVPEAMNA